MFRIRIKTNRICDVDCDYFTADRSRIKCKAFKKVLVESKYLSITPYRCKECIEQDNKEDV